MSEQAAEMVKRILEHDGLWLHKNGKKYRVICVANTHEGLSAKERDEYPLTVVYGDSEGCLWAKSPEAFLRNRVEKPPECCVCGTRENLRKDGAYGYRCSSASCVVF